MSTRKLAKKLGLLRQRSQSTSGVKKSVISNQIFSYLVVIDFESTCWREKNNYGQEIIEFPAVLLNTSSGEVESEFHTYVQPQEHPVLSNFCTELTGITQVQVEAGIPLQICLSRFNRWVQNLQLEKGMMFPNKQQTCSAFPPPRKYWDLGVCLHYECKRKQLLKPDVLSSWIDLRSTYRLFYSRKPKGLNGALQDLGIQFSGREHSGLDDARNTARLAARMMRDGCVLKITRSLETTPPMAKSIFSNNPSSAENKQEKQNSVSKKENLLIASKCSTSSNIPLQTRQKYSSLEEPSNSSSGQTYQSLITTKTLLNLTTAPLQGQNSKSVTPQAAPCVLSTCLINCSSTRRSSSSHVLCSTTVDCISDLPPVDEGEGELLVETDERCGSYDDVLLAFEEAVSEMDTISTVDVGNISDFDSRCPEWEEMDRLHLPEGPVILQQQRTKSLKMQNNTRDSSVTCKSVNMLNSNVKVFNRTNEKLQQSTTKDSDKCFAVPKVVDWSKLNLCRTGNLKLGRSHKNDQTKGVFSSQANPFLPVKTSTLKPSTMGPNPNATKCRQSLKSSFTIYTDPKNRAAESPCPSTSGSPHQPRNILASLPTNTLSSCAKQVSVALTAKGPKKITSPLCTCGRRSRRQVVSNGGPNHGRGFYCCPVRRSGGRGSTGRGCGFFKWESALMESSSVAPPALGSSVSFCQVNSILPCRPPLRKSY